MELRKCEHGTVHNMVVAEARLWHDDGSLVAKPLSSQTREVAMPATVLPQPALQVSRQNLDGDTILELQGKLDSSLTAELREEALSLVEPGCRLVLDLSEPGEISPTGVRMLLMFQNAPRNTAF